MTSALSSSAPRFAVARLIDRQPRFFVGRYDHKATVPYASPVTTGQPDQAKAYDDRNIAQIVCAALNVFASVKAGRLEQPWITIELPEAWL